MRFIAILTVISLSAVRAGLPAPGTLFYNNSWPEASAIATVGSPPRWLLVADNEIPSLALYSLNRLAIESHAPTLKTAGSPVYNVDDLEAVTVFPWDINGDRKLEATYYVLAGSSARSKNKGKVTESRDALFALTIDEKALTDRKSEPFTAASAVEYNRSVRGQIRALSSEHSDTAWGTTLRDSVWRNGVKPDDADPALSGAAGLNIEGLTVTKDGRGLLLGLRSPLVAGKALLIPLTNPVAALGLGESQPQPAALDVPIMLDLGGRGFRSIEWDASHNRYLICAGPPEDEGTFELLTWSGDPSSAPVKLTNPGAIVAQSIDPEGITPLAGTDSAIVIGDGTSGGPSHKGVIIPTP